VAIVELVVALPLMLILIMATAEFGRAFLQYATLSQGVQDGKRYVISRAMSGSTGNIVVTQDVVDATRNLVVFGNTVGTGDAALSGLTTQDVSVASIGGGYIRVSGSYRYDPVFPSIPMFGFGEDVATLFTFQAAVVGRAL
jgi:Flp pilus assembly protein TadG